MEPERRLICVIDDDESVRDSLPDLLRSYGYDAVPFDSALSFLRSDQLRCADCLILDVAMPEMTGPELQEELIRRAISVPIIFITAQSRSEVIRQVLQRGAVACLGKPFSEGAMIDAVRRAFRT